MDMIDVALRVVEDFEVEWYGKHGSVYTDNHFDEFLAEKQAYIAEHLKEVTE